MRALFLSHNRSDSEDAYNYRLRMLAACLNTEGIASRIVFLGDGALGSPTVLHALKVGNAVGSAAGGGSRDRGGGDRGSGANGDGVDIVHAGSAAGAFAASFLSRSRARRRIFDMHGDTVAEQRLAGARAGGWMSGLRVSQERWKESRGLRSSDRVLVVSEPLRAHVISRGFPGEHVWLVRNGVDLDRFRATSVYPARPVPRLVYAGRFDPWQGIEYLEALIRDHDLACELRIIGFEPRDEALRARWESIGNPRVSLAGRLGQSELVDELSLADALLLPRAEDPVTRVAMPTKFAEYLSVGRPVLLTDVGEPARFVREGECGMVSPATPDEFGAVVREFCQLSVENRARMAGPGRAIAERRFDWQRIGRSYASRLRESFGDGDAT